MITINQLNVINKSLERLKPTLYGLKAKYDVSVLEKNISYNSTPTSQTFSYTGHHYKPILEVKVMLSGQPDIYIITSGMIKEELQGFLEKIFGFVLPREHFLNKNVRKVSYKFEYNGKKLEYRDIITSPKYYEYVKNFRRENSPGTLVPIGYDLRYSINYSDLAVSEWADDENLNVFIECQTESFNYIDRYGKVTLITDELWDALLYETGEPIDIVKESLIRYLNTISADYNSELSNIFANEMSLMEKLSQSIKESYNWKYEASCNSLINPNDYPYDYTESDVSRKNLFISFCEIYLDE